MAKSLTISLASTIEFSSSHYAEITLREPTAEEWAEAEEFRGTRSTIKLMCMAGDTPEQVTQQFPISKVLQADRFFQACAEPAAMDGDAVPLPEAIEFGGKTYGEIVLREPTGAEWALAEELGGTRSTMKLVTLIAKLPEKLAGKFPVSVIIAADRYFQGFIEPAPATGAS